MAGAVKCANCGAAAGPRYCPDCGQELAERRGPLLEVGSELLSEWLSLDGQLVRSLRSLLRPGRASELYVQGKRAPYLRPVRLYFVASLALFSTALTLDTPDAAGFNVYVGGERVGSAVEGPNQQSLELLKGDGWLGAWTRELAGERLVRARALPKQGVVELVFSGFRRVLPTALILFVPFLALGLKLLYLRGKTERSLYLDHVVFAIHYQSALFFALALMWLATLAAPGGLVFTLVGYAATLMVMLFIYLPLALRRFYGQSRFWTAMKTFALLTIYAQLLGVIVNFSALYGLWEV